MSDATTPSSRWAEDGQPDPHGDHYACERAALTLGNLTDDELANAVFLYGNERPSMDAMAAGVLPAIVYLTAAKDRIRWLSRRLAAATAPQPAELAGQQGPYIGMPVGDQTVARAVASLDQSLTFAQDIRAEDVRIVLAALTATGKQQVGEDCTATLSARIAFEVELHGSLQRVAKELGIDVGYLSRLARGEKTNPSDEILEKFGLERTVTYTPIKREYAASPLHPRTKSA